MVSEDGMKQIDDNAILADSRGVQLTDHFELPANAEKPVAVLLKVLTEIGWDPKPEEEAAGFYVDFGPPHIPVSDAFAAIAPDTEQFVIYINFGPSAPSDRMDEIARFLTRANWGLMIGNFEMDYEDGHVRFKSSINFRGTELSETLIRNAILSAMNAVEHYADALIDVLASRKDAAQALKDLERKAN